MRGRADPRGLEWPPVATLLTGFGYIGAALVRRLVERGGDAEPIVALENFSSTPRTDIAAALPHGTILVEGDVADARDVARAFDALGTGAHPEQPIVVYHLAAQPSASVNGRSSAGKARGNKAASKRASASSRDRMVRN